MPALCCEILRHPGRGIVAQVQARHLLLCRRRASSSKLLKKEKVSHTQMELVP